MDKKVLIISPLVALLGLFIVFSSNTTQPAGASPIPSEKITICHSDGQSGNYSKITININSINDCVGAEGHDGHANDIIPSYTYSSCTYAGKNLSEVSWISNNCSQPSTPTPTPTSVPTVTPTPTTTLDCDGDGDLNDPNEAQECITPTPTPVLDCDGDTDGSNPNNDDVCTTPTPTMTVTPTTTPMPTATPTPGSNNGGGSGGGDGRSDGLSSCPSCTAAPQGNIQAVLGASTMASTGTFEENAMNLLAGMGILLMSISAGYAKIFKKARSY